MHACVQCRLKGEVQAGCDGDRSAMVVILQRSESAKVSIAGIQAPSGAGVGQMATLDGETVTFNVRPFRPLEPPHHS